MRPVRRSGVNKHKSARQFQNRSERTHPNNMKVPMRGGWRL